VAKKIEQMKVVMVALYRRLVQNGIVYVGVPEGTSHEEVTRLLNDYCEDYSSVEGNEYGVCDIIDDGNDYEVPSGEWDFVIEDGELEDLERSDLNRDLEWT